MSSVDLNFAMFHFVQGTCIVCANSMIAVSVFRQKYLRLRDYMIITSLALIDTIVGIVEIFFGLRFLPSLGPRFDSSKTACFLLIHGFYFSVCCSTGHVVLISLDRYLYIMKAFWYERFVTEERLLIIVGLTWLGSFLYGASIWMVPTDFKICFIDSILSYEYRVYLGMTLYYLAMIFIAYLHAVVYKQAVKHKRRISLQLKAVMALQQNESDSSTTFMTSKSTAFKTIVRHMSSARMFAVVCGLYVACWLPYHIVVLTNPLDRKSLAVTKCVGFLKSGLNVLTYPLFDHHFRRALKQLVCCRYSSPYEERRPTRSDVLYTSPRASMDLRQQSLSSGHSSMNTAGNSLAALWTRLFSRGYTPDRDSEPRPSVAHCSTADVALSRRRRQTANVLSTTAREHDDGELNSHSPPAPLSGHDAGTSTQTTLSVYSVGMDSGIPVSRVPSLQSFIDPNTTPLLTDILSGRHLSPQSLHVAGTSSKGSMDSLSVYSAGPASLPAAGVASIQSVVDFNTEPLLAGILSQGQYRNSRTLPDESNASTV